MVCNGLVSLVYEKIYVVFVGRLRSPSDLSGGPDFWGAVTIT